MRDQEQKLALDYPCEWTYKVIGSAEEAIRAAIADILVEKAYDLAFSNVSRTKKYVALNLTVQVENESERQALYMALHQHPALKMVL